MRHGDPPASPEGEADGGQARRNGETGIRGQKSDDRRTEGSWEGLNFDYFSYLTLCSVPYALCPMLYALCSMPYALCPMPLQGKFLLTVTTRLDT